MPRPTLRRRRSSLGLEYLEDRTTPTQGTYVVDNLAFTGDFSPGTGDDLVSTAGGTVTLGYKDQTATAYQLTGGTVTLDPSGGTFSMSGTAVAAFNGTTAVTVWSGSQTFSASSFIAGGVAVAGGSTLNLSGDGAVEFAVTSLGLPTLAAADPSQAALRGNLLVGSGVSVTLPLTAATSYLSAGANGYGVVGGPTAASGSFGFDAVVFRANASYAVGYNDANPTTGAFTQVVLGGQAGATIGQLGSGGGSLGGELSATFSLSSGLQALTVQVAGDFVLGSLALQTAKADGEAVVTFEYEKADDAYVLAGQAALKLTDKLTVLVQFPKPSTGPSDPSNPQSVPVDGVAFENGTISFGTIQDPLLFDLAPDTSDEDNDVEALIPLGSGFELRDAQLTVYGDGSTSNPYGATGLCSVQLPAIDSIGTDFVTGAFNIEFKSDLYDYLFPILLLDSIGVSYAVSEGTGLELGYGFYLNELSGAITNLQELQNVELGGEIGIEWGAQLSTEVPGDPNDIFVVTPLLLTGSIAWGPAGLTGTGGLYLGAAYKRNFDGPIERGPDGKLAIDALAYADGRFDLNFFDLTFSAGGEFRTDPLIGLDLDANIGIRFGPGGVFSFGDARLGFADDVPLVGGDTLLSGSYAVGIDLAKDDGFIAGWVDLFGQDVGLAVEFGADILKANNGTKAYTVSFIDNQTFQNLANDLSASAGPYNYPVSFTGTQIPAGANAVTFDTDWNVPGGTQSLLVQSGSGSAIPESSFDPATNGLQLTGQDPNGRSAQLVALNGGTLNASSYTVTVQSSVRFPAGQAPRVTAVWGYPDPTATLSQPVPQGPTTQRVQATVTVAANLAANGAVANLVAGTDPTGASTFPIATGLSLSGAAADGTAELTFDWDTSNLAPGTYYLFATVSDTVNATVQSAPNQLAAVTVNDPVSGVVLGTDLVGVAGIPVYLHVSTGSGDTGAYATGDQVVLTNGAGGFQFPTPTADPSVGWVVGQVYYYGVLTSQLPPGVALAPTSPPSPKSYTYALSGTSVVRGVGEFLVEQTTATVSGAVFNDVNGNGVFDPSTDVPIPGATVAGVPQAGGTTTTVTTDNGGNYTIPGVTPGAAYTVSLTVPVPYANPKPAAAQTVTPTSAGAANVNFALTRLATVSGTVTTYTVTSSNTVTLDYTRNSTVTVQAASGSSVVGQATPSTTTGAYSLPSLSPNQSFDVTVGSSVPGARVLNLTSPPPAFGSTITLTTPQATVSSGANLNPFAVMLFDVTGDGLLDIVWGGYFSNSSGNHGGLYYIPNKGTATAPSYSNADNTQLKDTSSNGITQPIVKLIPFDYTGQAAAGQRVTTWAALENDGYIYVYDGTSNKFLIGTAATAWDVAAGDIDGDGKADLMAVMDADDSGVFSNNTKVFLWLGSQLGGTTNFVSPYYTADPDAARGVAYVPPATSGSNAQVGQFVVNIQDNYSGDNYQSNAYGYYQGTINEIRGQPSISTTGYVGIGNLDNNPLSEYVATYAPSQAVYAVMNAFDGGASSFTHTTFTYGVTGPVASIYSPIVTDLNGDGAPDVLVAPTGVSYTGDDGSSLSIGTDTSAAATSLTIYTRNLSAVDTSGTSVNPLNSTAVGVPIDSPQKAGYSIGQAASGLVAAGDVNGDGLTDLLVANWSQFVLQVFLNTTGVPAASQSVTTSATEDTAGVNFALFVPQGSGTTAGVVYADDNRDGKFQQAERGRPGVTVYLDLNGNAVPDAGEPRSVSNEVGLYAFNGLAPGTYTVRLVEDGILGTAGAARTVTLDGTTPVTDADFGVRTAKNLTVTAPAGGADFHVARNNEFGGYLEVVNKRTGDLLLRELAADINSLTVTGAANAPDTLLVDTASGGPLGFPTLRYNAGGGAGDRLAFADGTFDTTFGLTPGRATVHGLTIDHTGVETIGIDAGAGADAVRVETPTTGGSRLTLDDVRGRVGVTGPGLALDFAGVETAALVGHGGGNAFRVAPQPGLTVAVVGSGLGDTLTVDRTGLTGFQVGPDGTITFDNVGPVIPSGLASVTTDPPLAPPEVPPLPPPVRVVLTGPGAGGGPQVNVTTPDGVVVASFFAFEETFTGGVRVAAADFTGDGVDDWVTAAGPGGGPRVRLWDGSTGLPLAGPLGDFYAFAPSFSGGVFVAAGDLNGDGRAELVVAAGAGGGPHVKVFDGATGAEVASFYAFEPTFAGGVRVSVGDLNGDGRPDLIAAAGPGGGPRVRAFDAATLAEVMSFYAYEPEFTGGVFVAAADTDGDGTDEVVTGPATGPGRVKVWALGRIDPTAELPIATTDGARVSADDTDGDGTDEILVAPGAGAAPVLQVWKVGSTAPVAERSAYGADFLGGVFVG